MKTWYVVVVVKALLPNELPLLLVPVRRQIHLSIHDKVINLWLIIQLVFIPYAAQSELI